MVLRRAICGAILLPLTFILMKSVESQKPFFNNGGLVRGMSESVHLVTVSVRSAHQLSDRWEIELEIHNDSQHTVFVLTDPIQADGKRGPYIGFDEADSSILNLSVRLYEGPNYLLFSNATGVKLTSLAPQTSRIETYALALPLHSTIPPYRERLAQSEARLIAHTKLKALKVSIGILPDDEGVRDLLRRKTFGPFATGGELIAKGQFKGEALMDVQTIISASYTITNSGGLMGRQR